MVIRNMKHKRSMGEKELFLAVHIDWICFVFVTNF